jgi:MFS-type transporter involved in bile tolerance (Atg22 family)
VAASAASFVVSAYLTESAAVEPSTIVSAAAAAVLSSAVLSAAFVALILVLLGGWISTCYKSYYKVPCSFLYKVPSVFCTGLSPNSQDVLCYPFSLFVLHLSHTTDLDSHSYSVIRSRYSYSTSPTLQILTAIRTPLSVLVIRTPPLPHYRS